MSKKDKLLIAGFAILPLIMGFMLGVRWCKFDPVTMHDYYIEEQTCIALESAHSILNKYLLQTDSCTKEIYDFITASDSIANLYNW